jgi:hypothetical protein
MVRRRYGANPYFNGAFLRFNGAFFDKSIGFRRNFGFLICPFGIDG